MNQKYLRIFCDESSDRVAIVDDKKVVWLGTLFSTNNLRRLVDCHKYRNVSVLFSPFNNDIVVSENADTSTIVRVWSDEAMPPVCSFKAGASTVSNGWLNPETLQYVTSNWSAYHVKMSECSPTRMKGNKYYRNWQNSEYGLCLLQHLKPNVVIHLFAVSGEFQQTVTVSTQYIFHILRSEAGIYFTGYEKDSVFRINLANGKVDLFWRIPWESETVWSMHMLPQRDRVAFFTQHSLSTSWHICVISMLSGQMLISSEISRDQVATYSSSNGRYLVNELGYWDMDSGHVWHNHSITLPEP